MMDEVPETTLTPPLLIRPEASNWHIMSPLPATTGVPLGKPVSPATSLLTLPITEAEPTISGSLARSTPNASNRRSDHCPVEASARNEPDDSDGSFARSAAKAKVPGDPRRRGAGEPGRRPRARSMRNQAILKPAQAGRGLLPAE